MFVSRGTTIEITACYSRKLREVLTYYTSRRHCGRIVVRDFDRSVELCILLIDGEIRACRGIDEHSNIVESRECIEAVSRYLDSDSCVVEVLEVDPALLELDLREFPSSVVDPEEAKRIVTQERGEAVKPEIVEVAAVPEEVKETIVEVRPAPTIEEVERRESRETIEISQISESCIDPLAVFNILRTASNVEQLSQVALSLENIVAMVVERARRSSDAVYIKAATDGAAYLRMYFDIKSKIMSVELVSGDERLCGSKAIEKAHSLTFKELLIWSR